MKDTEAIARMYAEDGAPMAPYAPIAISRQAIRNFDLTFEAQSIIVRASGDMALDRVPAPSRRILPAVPCGTKASMSLV